MDLLKLLGILAAIYLIGGAMLPGSWKRFYLIQEKEIAIVYSLGKFSRKAGPGPLILWPWEYVYRIVDTRLHSEEFTDNMVTNDNIPVNVKGASFWQVTNPDQWAFGVEDEARETYQRRVPQAGLRGWIASLKLTEILGLKGQRARVPDDVIAQINQGVNPAGLTVRNMSLVDFDLPDSLKNQLAEVAMAEQEAGAIGRTATAIRAAGDVWPQIYQSRQLGAMQQAIEQWAANPPTLIVNAGGGGSGGDPVNTAILAELQNMSRQLGKGKKRGRNIQ